MQPLASILIPCYNAEKWLAETLESAFVQTWMNKEIILVDDGSTDRSLAIAKQFASSNLKVISQDNRGASAARNRALQEAQGEFIQFLDADDLLATNKVEIQIECLQRYSPQCIAAGEWARFYKTPTEAHFTAEPVWMDASPVDWLVCSWEGGGMMHPAAWLTPRQIVEAAGFWNTNLSLNDDGEYFGRILLASEGVKFCWGAKTYYRSGLSNSLSRSQSRVALESAFLALELGTTNLLKHEDNTRTRHACATAYQRFIYSTYPDAIDLVCKAEIKVCELGGSDLLPSGGQAFQKLAQVVGWKSTKKLQKILSIGKAFQSRTTV